jgi:hypothetical protein
MRTQSKAALECAMPKWSYCICVNSTISLKFGCWMTLKESNMHGHAHLALIGILIVVAAVLIARR